MDCSTCPSHRVPVLTKYSHNAVAAHHADVIEAGSWTSSYQATESNNLYGRVVTGKYVETDPDFHNLQEPCDYWWVNETIVYVVESLPRNWLSRADSGYRSCIVFQSKSDVYGTSVPLGRNGSSMQCCIGQIIILHRSS